MDIDTLIQQLISQVQLKQLSTVDLVSNLKEAFDSASELKDRVEYLEKELKDVREKRDAENAEAKEVLESLEKECELLIDKYKKPYDLFLVNQEGLRKDIEKFSIESSYLHRENHHLKEILSAVLARVRVDENYSSSPDYNNQGSNQVTWNKSAMVEKPILE